MVISIDRMLRVILLTVCVGYWMAALPTLAHAFVGAAFERDFAVAGLVSSAAVFHTLGLVLLSAIFQRSLPGEGVSPGTLSSWRAADRVGQ